MPFLTIRLAIAVAVLAAVLLLFGPAACNKIRSLSTQAELGQEQTSALANSAGDAVATQANVAANQAASEDLTRSNREEITNAKGADQAVPADVARAGRNSLCRRASYRDRPECRVQQPRP